MKLKSIIFHMVLFFVFIAFLIFLLFYCFWYIFSFKKLVFCENLNSLENLFLKSNEKFTFKKLNKTSINDDIFLMYQKIKYPIFSEKILVKNKNFLIVVSNFITYKINTNQTKFRAKKDLILIDQIANVIASNLIYHSKCNLFRTYKKLYPIYSVRQKENKVFKILLGEKLLKLVIKIETEQNKISQIIQKSKSQKKFKKYKNQFYQSAQIYSIKKYNPNSTKLLHCKNVDNIIDKLFFELYLSKRKLELIVTYLTVIFS